MRLKEKLAKYLRNYDIDKIREQRVINSFAVGRKISYKENCEKRISNAIELLLAKESKRANSYFKAGLIRQESIPKMTPKKKVFESSNFLLRTDEFYRSIAEELVQNDIKCERKYG